MQHRQVEAAAVPRDELRRVFLDAVEEAADQLGLGIGRLADRPDANARRVAQRAGDRDDLLQVQRREVAAGRRAPPLREPVEHARVVDARGDVVDAADARDVGHRLDVEDEHGVMRAAVRDAARRGRAASARAASRRETRRWTGSGRRGRRR